MKTSLDADARAAQREAILALVEVALRRGITRHNISCACQDPGFMNKLERGHAFRIGTLRRAHYNITRLLATPAISPFLKDLQDSP